MNASSNRPKNLRAQPNTVSIVKSTYSSLQENLPRAIELAGGITLSGQNKVVLKINLCDARTPDTGAITHPALFGCRSKISEDAGGKNGYLRCGK